MLLLDKYIAKHSTTSPCDVTIKTIAIKIDNTTTRNYDMPLSDEKPHIALALT